MDEERKRLEYEQAKQKREQEAKKAVLAHEIAKQIAEATNTYADAFEVLELVQRNLDWTMRRQHKPTVRAYPVDRYNQIVEPRDIGQKGDRICHT